MTKLTKEQLIEDLKASTQNASGMFEISEDTICALMSMLTNAAPQLPQPAVVIDRQGIADMVHGKCSRIPGANFYNAAELAIDEVEACLAAMLQGENHTEQHLDMVDHFIDANEKVDCRLPFAQWLSQQNEPIDVDCGCVTTEAFYHWLRVAYEAGNSPVTPEGWIPVSERMPESDGNYWGWWSESKRQGPVWFIKSDLQAQFQSSEITHWMSLPAAPQQE